ncbi:MAG: sulfatase, partial [Betaproteobacteria bacterium]
ALTGRLFHLDGGSVAIYRRMIRQMDEGVGALLDALADEGLARDTLVVFTSDNGGERFSDNWPLVGGKMDLTEGGIRVPWIAHWPAVVAPGRTTGQLCMTMDWSATLLELGGATADPRYPLDGVSLAQLLGDTSKCFDRPLYWRMNHRDQRACRFSEWKYLRVDGCDYLFNLDQDERERANQAAVQPERLAQMVQSWEAWNATMPPIPSDAIVSLGYSVRDMPQR